MSVSGLFTRRVRGVRLVNLWGAGVLLVLVVALYLLKTLAGGERADIARAETLIAEERRRIRLLEAEVAYLEQPGRIGGLAEARLGMAPLSGTQETDPAKLQEIAQGKAAAKAAVAAEAPQ